MPCCICVPVTDVPMSVIFEQNVARGAYSLTDGQIRIPLGPHRRTTNLFEKNIEISAQFVYCSNLPDLSGTQVSRHALAINNLLDKNRIYAIKTKFSRSWKREERPDEQLQQKLSFYLGIGY